MSKTRYFVIAAAGDAAGMRDRVARKHGPVHKMVLFDAPSRTSVYGVTEFVPHALAEAAADVDTDE